MLSWGRRCDADSLRLTLLSNKAPTSERSHNVPLVGTWNPSKKGGRWWKMVEDGGRWWKMVEDGGRWWKMVEDGGRWWKMVEDGGRWWKMVEAMCANSSCLCLCEGMIRNLSARYTTFAAMTCFSKTSKTRVIPVDTGLLTLEINIYLEDHPSWKAVEKLGSKSPKHP